jgi:hypothetical protein
MIAILLFSMSCDCVRDRQHVLAGVAGLVWEILDSVDCKKRLPVASDN